MSGDTQPGPYAAAYQRSMTNPDGFWREAASLIDWYTEPETIMDASALPFSRGFAGGELNTYSVNWIAPSTICRRPSLRE